MIRRGGEVRFERKADGTFGRFISKKKSSVKNIKRAAKRKAKNKKKAA